VDDQTQLRGVLDRAVELATGNEEDRLRAGGGRIVRFSLSQLYAERMDVAVSDLRAHLSEWLERARGGEEVVVTERGVPVARLLGVTTTTTLERLAAEGVIGRPERAQRTPATGRKRPRPRHPVSALVSQQRR
jgi:prevent-host-death family protein